MRRPVLVWVGWVLLVLFLAAVFLFCLFTLALILVVTVLGLVEVIAMGYRPDRLDPVVTLLAFLMTVLCLGAMCVNAYLALRSILGGFWRLLNASRVEG
jgi:hypothetical protein